ncbi:MAG: hypothetical protein ACREEK_25125 [Bradyrhizobium sp.]
MLEIGRRQRIAGDAEDIEIVGTRQQIDRFQVLTDALPQCGIRGSAEQLEDAGRRLEQGRQIFKPCKMTIEPGGFHGQPLLRGRAHMIQSALERHGIAEP